MHLSRRALLASAATAVVSGGLCPPLARAEENLAPFSDLLTKFIAEHKLPGAACAVTRGGKLVYARGFGLADVENKVPVKPDALFRIASVSKPITGVAVMMLVDRGKVRLDEPVMNYLKLKPAVPPGARFDLRWEKVTVRHCLQHTGGWDRDKKGGFDPIGTPRRITRALQLDGPPAPDDVMRYMMGRSLDFDPGARMAYSNLGYLVLGRVIEAVTGQRYEPWVLANVLNPVGAGGMLLARGVPEKRPAAEVRYYDSRNATGECLYPPRVGRKVPLPDGGQNVEAYEAHGGWVSSAIDLVRFACAFDYDRKSPLLSTDAIKEMWARPEGLAGFDAEKKPLDAYYGCGWSVRPVGDTGKANTWHPGLISGTSSLLVRRWDGLNWAVLFNTDANAKGEQPADLIDGPMHTAADAVKTWPEGDLFEMFRP
jgi:CubicO group peptidase (beta-lactamase class C family)